MIDSLKDLKRHLEAAVQLELSVIPPYLCALYSLHPAANQEVSQIIRSVVVEEMLHMVLAANVLNAVDGRPRVDDPKVVPRYPAYLPDGERVFEVHLLPFSEIAVETFLKIEEPAFPHAAGPESRRPATPLLVAQVGSYPTVGEFYQAIVDGLEHLVKKSGERKVFGGDPARQITPEHYYGGGGRPTVVHDLATARTALREIMDQGEGKTLSMFDGDGDLAHFFRFMEIKHRRRYKPGQRGEIDHHHFDKPAGEPFPVDYRAVYPMLHDPRTEDYPEGELRRLSRSFNLLYTRLLHQLQGAFDGRQELLQTAVGTMFELKYAALELIRNPLPGHPGHHAGPTFEYAAD